MGEILDKLTAALQLIYAASHESMLAYQQAKAADRAALWDLFKMTDRAADATRAARTQAAQLVHLAHVQEGS